MCDPRFPIALLGVTLFGLPVTRPVQGVTATVPAASTPLGLGSVDGSLPELVPGDSVTDTALKRPAFPVIGRPAPPLRVAHWLNVSSGNPLTLGDGHIYLLDFTALWCGSCPETYPILSDLFEKYGPARLRPIFVTQLYGLAEDHFTMLRPAEELASFPAYFAKHHVTAPVAILDTVHSGMRAYTDDGKGGYALPKLVLIDGQGIVRDVMTGWDAAKARTQLFADVAQLVTATLHHAAVP